MLKLAHVRKTTRRSKLGDGRVVHPHLLRDQSLAPRIELAIRYFESSVGRPRKEMDAEMVVQLFGDHKLANCLVESLAPWYRYTARSFADELAEPRLDQLRELGITNASELRLWIYREANHVSGGFVSGGERFAFLGTVSGRLGVDAATIEHLATLDAPQNAVLVRFGARPSPADVIARYNFEVVAALLANAKLVRLTFAHALSSLHTLEAICGYVGVRASVSRQSLVFHGQQDAMNGWARHGAKLAMLVSLLLTFGLPVRAGEATVTTRDGDEMQFPLSADSLRYLGAAGNDTIKRDGVNDILPALRAAETMAAQMQAARRSDSNEGWTIRRGLDALVTGDGIDPIVLTFIRGGRRVPVVVVRANRASQSRLNAVAGGQPVVLLLSGDRAIDPTGDQVSGAAMYDGAALATHTQLDPATLLSTLHRALEHTARLAGTMRLRRVFDEALSAGVLVESHVAQGLGCHEDAVSGQLSAPEARGALERVGLRYVEGFGLCSRDMLDRARTAASDVSQLRDGEPVGHAWTVRVLGRKLREVTGVNEGIECLIAYLGAA